MARKVGTEEECEAALRAAAELRDKAVLIECLLDPADCSGGWVQGWASGWAGGGAAPARDAGRLAQPCCHLQGCGRCCWLARTVYEPRTALRPCLLAPPAAVEVLTLGKLMSQVGAGSLAVQVCLWSITGRLAGTGWLEGRLLLCAPPGPMLLLCCPRAGRHVLARAASTYQRNPAAPATQTNAGAAAH